MAGTVTIVDYGVGNLFSLRSSFDAVGVKAVVSGDPDAVRGADKIILPGVGAFGDAAKKLTETGLGGAVRDAANRGVPVMGICLGMQLLFERSYEFGEYDGLGLLRGEIRPISEVIPPEYKIPHIGWNALRIVRDTPVLSEVRDGDCVYFVHSFHAVGCEDSLTATTEYGAALTAAVAGGVGGNVYGCQFHPEKSGNAGLSILRAFAKL